MKRKRKKQMKKMPRINKVRVTILIIVLLLLLALIFAPMIIKDDEYVVFCDSSLAEDMGFVKGTHKFFNYTACIKVKQGKGE